MSQLVESLKLKDGIIRNLDYHQERMNSSLEELFPGAEPIELARAIAIPEDCKSGLYKIRVIYNRSIEKIEIEPYRLRSIQSLKIVNHESVDYHLKYMDRQVIQELFAQRGTCDDVLIIKNGFVTDSFTANVLFFDGTNWFTPTTPLLKGTQRQCLLDEGIIFEKEIRAEDISRYQKVGLINALISFEEMPVITIDKIFQ
jgi:4-amino-4-deoxychorismate lyase